MTSKHLIAKQMKYSIANRKDVMELFELTEKDFISSTKGKSGRNKDAKQQGPIIFELVKPGPLFLDGTVQRRVKPFVPESRAIGGNESRRKMSQANAGLHEEKDAGSLELGISRFNEIKQRYCEITVTGKGKSTIFVGGAIDKDKA